MRNARNTILILGGETLPLSIRLRRMGRKKQPFYRIIVADTRKPRQGESVDDLGYYNPMTDPAQTEVNAEKALEWLKNGAKPTETARSLLSKAGVMKSYHESKYPPKQASTEIVEDAAEAKTEEQPEEASAPAVVEDEAAAKTEEQPDSE